MNDANILLWSKAAREKEICKSQSPPNTATISCIVATASCVTQMIAKLGLTSGHHSLLAVCRSSVGLTACFTIQRVALSTSRQKKIPCTAIPPPAHHHCTNSHNRHQLLTPPPPAPLSPPPALLAQPAVMGPQAYSTDYGCLLDFLNPVRESFQL